MTTIIDTPTASQEIITSKVIADHAAPGMPGGSELVLHRSLRHRGHAGSYQLRQPHTHHHDGGRRRSPVGSRRSDDDRHADFSALQWFDHAVHGVVPGSGQGGRACRNAACTVGRRQAGRPKIHSKR